MSHLLQRFLPAVMVFALAVAPANGAWAADTDNSPESPAQSLAERVQKRYADIHSFRAKYTRLSRFKAIGGQAPRLVEGSGVLTWGKPLSLRLEQFKPRVELVVTTPDGVWWSRPKKKRADLYPLKQFTEGLRSLMDALGGLSGLAENYLISDPDQEEKRLGQGGPMLVLTPKVRRADLARLLVWFQPGGLLLQGFRITSMMGDITEYRFSDIQANPPMRQGLFSFTPAEDFKVRDHRPLRDLMEKQSVSE